MSRRGGFGHKQWVRNDPSFAGSSSQPYPAPQSSYPGEYQNYPAEQESCPGEYYQDQGYDGYDYSYGYENGYNGYNGYNYNHDHSQSLHGGGGYDNGYHYGAGQGGDVWSSAAAAIQSVQGAPTGPAAHSQGGYWNPAAAPYYPHHSDPYYNTRSYHSSSSSSPAPQSRFHPYTKDNPPTGPSAMYVPPHSRPKLPPAIRAAPRTSYVQQAKQESKTLTEEEAKERKLLVVLDLNGTLVFRAKTGNGRAVDSVRAVPRPYLRCFLEYCLGPNNSTGKPVEWDRRPHGSHFWQAYNDTGASLEPSSSGKAEVVVWSSAQPFNVDAMVRGSFDPEVRARVLRVWARDTLVPVRFYHGKSESVKDLEIVWAELNGFANGQLGGGRIMAEVRDKEDQARPDDKPAVEGSGGKKEGYKGKKHKERLKREKEEREKEGVSAALEAALTAEELGPWGASNTVLVDDSSDKARLQPWNHLLIPEYGKRQANMMRSFIRQQVASEEDGVGVEEESEAEYDSDLSLPKSPPPPTLLTAAEGIEGAEGEETEGEEKKKPKKPIPESRLDDVLLQTIGVLETLRYQSNVSAFMYKGGTKGYGEEKTALNDEQRVELEQQGGTPEYWAKVGREACEKLGIEVRAWVPGQAASATAALLEGTTH